MTGNTKKTTAPKKTAKKKIALALQGGGAHGAFTWGVLDKLLEDGRFEIEGLSGTSAGGMTAIAVAQGIAQGGNEEARKMLTLFWTKIAESGKNSMMKPSPMEKLEGKYTMNKSPFFMAFENMTKVLSPYEFNPMDKNPLRDVVNEIFDFDLIHKAKNIPQVFVAATHVATGKVVTFGNKDLKAESVLASACLPFLHHAVEVDGEYYWDGGYIGNPALYPIINNCETTDIVLVRINPINRPTLPTNVQDISDRLNEITCNAAMMREMRAVTFITDLIDSGKVKKDALKRLNMHDIAAEEEFQKLNFSSKLNSDWEFLTHLRDVGRKTAAKWIKDNYDHIGKKSTADIHEKFT